MANTFKNLIILDTFTSAIDLNSSLGYPAGTMLKICSIEWQEPTTIDHTAVITNDYGDGVFDETCVTVNQSIIKYYNGLWTKNLNIGVSGVGSGKIIIILE